MENWQSLIDWIMKAILGGIFSYAVHILSEMKNSIESLNEKVAKVIERTEWHSKELEKLDYRMTRIEEKKS